ncbi:MAG: beta,4 N-acetylgalactosaminyltransferase 1-like [Acidobacteriaceae bacterium]|nr:beta,4 N-acetylgalactosaminyltransferase 1-like [Acidobacteriaceae bacterium]
MGSEDFDFSTMEVRQGIDKLLDVMNSHPEIAVSGGRHQNNPYEGFLEYKPGEYIKEHRLTVHPQLVLAPVDLMVNYFLARVDAIHGLPWDERMKIGGEHGDWFLEMKQQGKKVLWVNGVKINAQPHDPAKQRPEYPRFRGRAKELGHKIFLDKRNIKIYRGFDN